MNREQFFIFFCFIFFITTDISYSAGLIYREQQVKAMKQQQSQEEYQQEYGQQAAQDQGQQAAVQQTYQQTVDARNQAIAQAIVNAHNQAGSSGNGYVNNTAVNQVQQQNSGPGMAPTVQSDMPQQQFTNSGGSSDVKDVVDLSEVWKKLDNKSAVWNLLIDDQAKLLTVSEYINRFQQEGVKINGSPVHYVQLINQIAEQNPQMLQMPFGQLVQILAIVDYDFDNGMDKDVLAKKVLGEAGFEANKKRFTQQQPSASGSAGP